MSFRRNMGQRAQEKLQMELLPKPAVIQSRSLMQISMLDCQTVHLGFVGLLNFFCLSLLIFDQLSKNGTKKLWIFARNEMTFSLKQTSIILGPIKYFCLAVAARQEYYLQLKSLCHPPFLVDNHRLQVRVDFCFLFPHPFKAL